ncbi:MAG: XdhC family protein [Synergistaceae bacterium]|nr:XdhC family protein [Synergistaceae bacterium]
MENVYRELFRTLKNGEEAFLTTVCEPGGGVVKTLRAGAPRDGEGSESFLSVRENDGQTTLVERFLPHPRMVVFGGGHIAVPLSRMASLLRFRVTVFDDRPSFADRTRFPEAGEVICESFERIARRLTFRASDYAVIMTRGHRHDIECLRNVLSGEIPYYVGMIGSRRRVLLVRRQMVEEGFPQEVVDRLHSPVGLDIGAVTPEEIAVSILAEAVQVKRQGGARRNGEGYADMPLMEALAACDGGMAVVTVLSAEGSTPRGAGAKMAVRYDGSSVGSIGGGCAEADVIRDARDILLKGGYCFKTVDMTDEEDGMACGGRMKVLIESM